MRRLEQFCLKHPREALQRFSSAATPRNAIEALANRGFFERLSGHPR